LTNNLETSSITLFLPNVIIFFQVILKFDIANMSANNREPDIISLCDDMVEDLAHVEPEIVEDESDVDLSMNDLNKPSAYNGPLEPSLGMEFDDVEDARTCFNA
jgi:hypothetical protein